MDEVFVCLCTGPAAKNDPVSDPLGDQRVSGADPVLLHVQGDLSFCRRDCGCGWQTASYMLKDMPLSQLSEYVSFVTQDNFLFRCSLLENIRLGNPKATDEEVKAARAAQCEEFIEKLPLGYDTPAGEAGKRLSGGEKQRIAALTKGKTLLVIAHRLSTIKAADNIVVLKSGTILAEGKQEELLESCPLYKDMWEAHIGAKNWAVSSAAKEA